MDGPRVLNSEDIFYGGEKSVYSLKRQFMNAIQYFCRPFRGPANKF